MNGVFLPAHVSRREVATYFFRFLSDFPEVKNSGHGFIARVIVVIL